MKGDGRCSIDKQAKGIAGRGVRLDVAALHGVEWPAAGTVITPEELQAAAERQGGVHVGPGDILLVRTGWRRKFLTARDVATVASDNWAVEVRELFFTVPPLKVTGGVGNADRSVGVEVMQ
ncbi:cyclase family protein [Streptomyces klenkii]|uniref:cyclase family protein n=1 Tax=Streptomyces klenkii TaxID=1420899 RepID=UPI0034399000